MKYICDAPGKTTWFRLENEIEAEEESRLMNHAVAKHFRQSQDAAAASFKPPSDRYIEQEIGRAAHIQREMPLFLTLRDREGKALVTAMLPPEGKADQAPQKIVVGPSNSDPYPDHQDAIEALGAHFGMSVGRDECFPYRR